jgi:dephospho-CoA kinase
MLRVGLTGGLGSGKSTAAGLFRGLGAHVFEADAIGRELMEPGQAVYAAIVETFGPGVVLGDGQLGGRLDRVALARIAFGEGRVEELNAIVHPATIARQQELAEAIASRKPHAVVIVESALIFETKYGGEDGWRRRFDKLILVTAAEELRVARFVARMAAGRELSEAEGVELEAEAYRRMARQIPDEQKMALCDYVLTNDGPVQELEWQVEQLWPLLLRDAAGVLPDLNSIQ